MNRYNNDFQSSGTYPQKFALRTPMGAEIVGRGDTAPFLLLHLWEASENSAEARRRYRRLQTRSLPPSHVAITLYPIPGRAKTDPNIEQCGLRCFHMRMKEGQCNIFGSLKLFLYNYVTYFRAPTGGGADIHPP